MARTGEWDPMKELVGVQGRMNELFERALARTNFEDAGELGSWTPVCDVVEGPAELELYLELPGLEQKDIDLRLDGDELIVEGERRMERDQSGERYHRVERSYGSFRRRFDLPPTVNREAVEAHFRDGLLHIVMPHGGMTRQEPRQVTIS